ncbi:hypothetical protein E3N88_23519 [Mikania micrantha]|uniref:Uncharacterized protein n=1 Tax=Mikania micrantha TaxID=192012 RepID=A0A5N6NG64_9ASTR|nr:hypothetical protein E3N88_23519 [Mikania micrantha]
MGKRARGCHSLGQSGHDRRTCPALRGTNKASSSSSYKYKKDEKTIERLEKSFSTEKKDEGIMWNSIGMLNGLLLANIRSNIANLSDLLDDTGEGVEIARDYMVN